MPTTPALTKSIRWSTLVRDFGPVKHARSVSGDEWERAVSEGRMATVYHGASDWSTPVEAVPRHHGCVNTICKIVFAKPLPKEIVTIVGMRNSDSAFEICNP